MEVKPVYLAIDPGETTGWATFDAQGNVITMGQVKQKDFTKRFTELLTSDLKCVIIEEYKNYAKVRQKDWSVNQTSKNIGALELLAEMRGVPWVRQPAYIKSIGYKWGGIPTGAPSAHHISHQYDAWAHGVYWLQQNGIREPGRAIMKKDSDAPEPEAEPE